MCDQVSSGVFYTLGFFVARKQKWSDILIEIKSVSKTFKTKKDSFTALNNISLNIEDGDIFGIIGLSGAGKSTLVRCINLLERPTTGNVIIDG